MLLFPSRSLCRFVNPDSGCKSGTVLLSRYKILRLCACSSPVRSVIPLLVPLSPCKYSIVWVVMAFPILRCTAAAKCGSGIDMVSERGSKGVISIGKCCDRVIFPCTSITASDTDLLFGIKPGMSNSAMPCGFPFKCLQPSNPPYANDASVTSGVNNCT